MKKKPFNSLRDLGLLIKVERKKRALSQTQLGQITGTSINFISQLESGKATAQVGKVLKVLQVLGFELHCLRGSKGLVLLKSEVVDG
ncbi:MAG: helix-turn-helix domain-containing protein [bacterium]